MSPVAFDALTRALGGAQSRREAIRILGGTLASAAFGTFTVGCGDDDGPTNPGQQPECDVPSACGSRSFCNEDETCICVRSAEDTLRCAQLPSSCALEPCTTSADCAHLGENFFCDSPGSGCCSTTDQFCLAPCGTAYPDPEPPADPGTGLEPASQNADDVLFFFSHDQWTTTYYHGIRHPDGRLEVVYLTHEDFWGVESMVVLNEGLVPVLWSLGPGGISVRRTSEAPIDPHRAFHAFATDAGERGVELDIVPSNLSALLDRAETITGTSYAAARAFIANSASDTWPEIVALASAPGQQQPRHLVNAIAISTAAAYVAMYNALSPDAAATYTMPSRASSAPSNLADLFRTAKDYIIVPLLQNMLNEDLGPKTPKDPNAPTVDILLCQGATSLPPACHYILFLYVGSSEPCVSFCRTDLGCYTNICMPMSFGLEDAQNARRNV